MQIVVDGLLTNYKLSGSGKTIVMVHGWGSDLNSFNDLQEGLSEYHRVLSMDLPGMGKTSKPKKDWSLEDFAEFVNNLLKKLEITELYAVIGHSNGGAIATKMIANGLVSPKKLVLLASSGIRNTQNTKKKMLSTVAKAGKKSVFFLPKNTQTKIKSRLYSSIGSEGLLIPEMEQTFRNVVGEDIKDIAKLIRVPALLIYGELDTSTPQQYGEKLSSAIKDSRLEVVKEAGHFVQLDQPSKVSRLIKDFLS